MSSSTLSPKESGRFIAEAAKFVKINAEGVKKTAETISELLERNALPISGTPEPCLHAKGADDEAVNWLFLVNTLNFCFWSSPTDGEPWRVSYGGKSHEGYFALCAAVNRALDEGYPITDPKYYSQVSLRDLKTILRGDDDFTSIPLLNKRLDCLHEVGLVLLERFDGKFTNCVTLSERSAEKLLGIIVENFPCFKDEAVYRGQKVSFYKRAQILIGDIWMRLKEQNEDCFHDVDKLSMFADYRVPQTLVHFNVLEYDDSLRKKLEKDVLLESGSEEEVEIRGCSIHAVELINREVHKLRKDVVADGNEHPDGNSIVCNSVMIDHYLWNFRRLHASELKSIPFHKTLSIYY